MLILVIVSVANWRWQSRARNENPWSENIGNALNMNTAITKALD